MISQFINWVLGELARPLVIFGFLAQFVFFLRFVVQWFESERRGRSHLPVAFWWLSVLGGVMILIYAALEHQLVFACASILSLIIYIRNLMLIYQRSARIRNRRQRGFPTILDPEETREIAAPSPSDTGASD